MQLRFDGYQWLFSELVGSIDAGLPAAAGSLRCKVDKCKSRFDHG